MGSAEAAGGQVRLRGSVRGKSQGESRSSSSRDPRQPRLQPGCAGARGLLGPSQAEVGRCGSRAAAPGALGEEQDLRPDRLRWGR